MKKILLLLCLIFIVISCSARNRDYIMPKAEEIWKQQGFEIVAYEGYNWGQGGVFGCSYGGAEVWYRLKKIPDNGVTYSGYLYRWGKEIHVYGPKAIEAITPGK